MEAPRAVSEALGESWRPPGRSGGRPGGVSRARGAVLKPCERRLVSSQGCHGAVSGPLEAVLEPSGALPRPLWTHPDSSGQRLANLLNSIVFSIVFFGSEGIMELLEASSELLNSLRGILDAISAL